MNVLSNDIKQKVQDICDNFLSEKAKIYDNRLTDGGGFHNDKNFYHWEDNKFVINFFSISQDDFLRFYEDDDEFFENIARELKELTNPIMSIVDFYVADDCPIIFFELE